MTIYNNILKQTPQSRPLPGHNQIQNNAGGYVYEITPQQMLERFLLIGSCEGTYYVNEQKLTEQNATSVINYIKTNGSKVVSTLTDFALNNRTPKMDAILFVLALACTYGDVATKKSAYSAISVICKTGTHLFTFLENVNSMRGWSRGLRNAVSRWYTTKSDDKLAYQLVKYRQRNGWTHRDALRLAHPTPLTVSQGRHFEWAVGKGKEKDGFSNLILAFETAQKLTNPTELANLIRMYNLTWEMIPTELLNNEVVLTALLDKMPTVALTRNLNRFSKNGVTTGLSNTTKAITAKLNKESVKASGIHPLNMVNTARTYAQGKGDKGSSVWPVNQTIVDSLNDAYYHSLENVVPTNKSILLGLDVSGSMTSPVANMGMSAAQIGAVLALTVLKTEPNSEMISFDTQGYQPHFGKHTSLNDVLTKTLHGGGTDCSIPFQYALKTKNNYDAIIILTDNETWAGKQHGIVALNEYRKNVNKNVKVIEIAMVSNPYSTMPSNDPNLLRIVGFDSSVTSIINQFLNS